MPLLEDTLLTGYIFIFAFPISLGVLFIWKNSRNKQKHKNKARGEVDSMVINNNILPSSFTAFIKSNTATIEVGRISLINNKDSYGNNLETEIGEMYLTDKK